MKRKRQRYGTEDEVETAAVDLVGKAAPFMAHCRAATMPKPEPVAPAKVVWPPADMSAVTMAKWLVDHYEDGRDEP